MTHILNKTGAEVNRDLSEGLDNQPKQEVVWDDLRVSANDTSVNGSNPPVDGLFKNDGNEVPGTAYALSFLSTSQGNLTLPDNVVFNTSQNFYFSFWLRPVIGTENNIECLRKNNVFDLDFTGTNQLSLVVSGVGTVQSSVQFNRGNWNYITIMQDTAEGEIYLYINNVSAGMLVGTMADNTNDFQYNRQETLYDIDYIEYWSEIKTPAQISVRYSSGAGSQLIGNETDLKGLWELNDGAGTNVIEKTGIASDGTISGGTEGVQWDWIGGHVGNVSSGSRGVILKFFSPDISNEVYFTIQFPHARKSDSNIVPHLHITSLTDGGVGEKPVFGLEYTWSNIGDIFSDTSTIYTTDLVNGDIVAYRNEILLFPELNGTGKGLSSQMICRLFRDVDNVNDTFDDFIAFIEFDVHYQIDQAGSRQQFIK